MKYNWRIKDLVKCRNDLIRILKDESDKDKFDYISLVLSSINDYIDETKGIQLIESVDYDGRMSVISDELVAYRKSYSLVSLFENITSEFLPQINSFEEKLSDIVDENGFGVIPRATINNDRTMSLTEQFYRNFSSSLYPTFKHAYDQRHSSIRFLKMDGVATADSAYFDIIDRYFINSSKTNDISKLYNNIHEFGHVISYLVNPRAIYLTKMPFYTEVASMFPEIVARYENIGNYDTAQLAFDEYAQLASLVGTSIALSFHTPFVNLWKEHNSEIDEQFFKEADKYYDCDKDMVDDYLDTHITDDGDYVISYLTVLELFHLYKRDKEKALKIYEEILRCPYNEDLHSLVSSHLDLGKNTAEEANEIIKKLTLNLRKIGINNV